MNKALTTKELYINPFTDFGFKKLFGEEANKDLLEDFLRELLKNEEGEIRNLNYIKSEHLGSTIYDRKAIFDLYCENEKGEKFIIELQKAKQQFFKDRTLFYSTFPIREQAEKGEWNYQLQKVYTIAILDFIFEEDKKDTDKFLYRVKLSDIETLKVFYDKLTFVYLEMPKFNKSIEECDTRFDKWLYVIKNLHRLERIPDKLKEKIFSKLFKEAEIANLEPEQMLQYEESLKTYRDLHSVLETARIEAEKIGIEKGIIKEKKEIAVNAIHKNLPNDFIADLTGLTIEEIEKLRTDLRNNDDEQKAKNTHLL